MLLYGVFYHVIRLGGNPKKAEKMIAEFLNLTQNGDVINTFTLCLFAKSFCIYG